MNSKSHYNKKLKHLARKLRNDSTMGEAILWGDLKEERLFGFRFNRQYSIKIEDKSMIVDFICRKLKLVIEIDGYSHNFKFDEDKERDLLLTRNGYVVLRIQEVDVRRDIENVLREIEFKLEELSNI